ncbi:MAG: pyridoxamine 5'-phosphate oxidase [Betaproteobacteria bacterium]|nr:MAG: pyridoxamine 5'-phosphate oxidase [Betaproteobacteria bacterium]
MAESLSERAQRYLRQHHVMTLASHGDEGVWAAAVFYANDGFAFYFLSSPASRHCRNLTRDPRVSAAVQEDCSDWRKIKGVQLEGIVSVLAGEEEIHARSLYGEKFPVVGKLQQAPAAIVKALAKVCWYKLIPRRLYFIDNAAGFGHRDEIDLL